MVRASALCLGIGFAHVLAFLRLPVPTIPRAVIDLRRSVDPNLSRRTTRGSRAAGDLRTHRRACRRRRRGSWSGRGPRCRSCCGGRRGRRGRCRRRCTFRSRGDSRLVDPTVMTAGAFARRCRGCSVLAQHGPGSSCSRSVCRRGGSSRCCGRCRTAGGRRAARLVYTAMMTASTFAGGRRGCSILAKD